MASQGALAMRLIGGVVAHLIIAHDGESLGEAELRTREHDRQQHHGLGQGQGRGFFNLRRSRTKK
jgi:hypothetical protein